MIIIYNGLIVINNDNDFTTTEYKSQRIFKVDTSYILSRSIYVDRPSAFFYVYDVLSNCIIKHISYSNAIRLSIALTYSEPNKYAAVLQRLMTSTTMFYVSYLRLVLYSRSRFWILDRVKQVLRSYRPIALDESRNFQVALSADALVTYQNANVCHVQTLAREDRRAFIFQFPSHFRIVSICTGLHGIYVLLCTNKFAYYGLIRISCIYQMTACWNLFDWSDDLIVCIYNRLYLKSGKKYCKAPILQENVPVEWTYEQC